MKLNISIETDKEVWNSILDHIINLASGCDAKTLEIEGLDECEPFYTEEEIANIINDVENERIYPINIILKSKSMKTSKLQGYFDVRKYAKNVERTKRALCGENETITFSTTFAPTEVPTDLKEFAREYTNKNNEPRVAVQFKVSRNCKWYDGNTYKPMSKPLDEAHTYSVLEGKKYEVVIDYTALHGDVTKMEAHGYWANAILLKECDTNPFAEEAAAAGVPLQADAPTTDAPMETPAADAVEAVKQITNNNGDDELPF